MSIIIIVVKTVCRNDEVRIGLTGTVELCVDDQWLNVSRLSSAGMPQLSTQQFAPRSLQLSPHLDGVSVTWEAPPEFEEVAIMGYDITCSTRPQSSETLMSASLSIAGNSTSAVLPLLTTELTDYTCCVTSHKRGDTGLAMFSEACENIHIPTPSPPEPDDDNNDEDDRSVLVLVLGVLVAMLLLALVVALTLVILMARKRKLKNESEQQ